MENCWLNGTRSSVCGQSIYWQLKQGRARSLISSFVFCFFFYVLVICLMQLNVCSINKQLYTKIPS